MGEGPGAQQRSGCTHHLSSLWANPLGRGEIAPPATSSSSFPLPVVTVTSALLGVRLRLGGINFVQVSIFPDAGQPEELSLLVLFQRRLRGWEVRGCGRVDKAPLQPASQAECEWGREELRGGGEREGAALPGAVIMALGAGLRPRPWVLTSQSMLGVHGEKLFIFLAQSPFG